MSSNSNSNNNRRRSPVAVNSKIADAINHWYNGHITKENKTWYYKFIRNSPVVRFKNDANAIRFLKQFHVSNNNSNYHRGNSTFAGFVLQSLPKHRNYYIMNTQPFHVPYGNRGMLNIPGMVRVQNQTQTNPRGRLGLVNKVLMNRYLEKRSQTLLTKNTTNLKKTRTLIRAAEKLFGNIEQKRRKQASNRALTASLREGLRLRRIYRQGLNEVKRKYPTRNT